VVVPDKDRTQIEAALQQTFPGRQFSDAEVLQVFLQGMDR
jgi:hypothetical protein